MNNKKYFILVLKIELNFYLNPKVCSFFNFAKQAFKNWKINLPK